jgi:CheY-like chemotaxis protein
MTTRERQDDAQAAPPGARARGPLGERPIRVLLIEDNPGDALLIRLALEQAGIRASFDVIADGDEAAAFVLGRIRSERVPDLVLLDLTLPGRSGKELLGLIREAPSLRDVPVIVLTGSESTSDRLETAALGANGYMRKGGELETFMRMGAQIGDLWCALLR